MCIRCRYKEYSNVEKKELQIALFCTLHSDAYEKLFILRARKFNFLFMMNTYTPVLAMLTVGCICIYNIFMINGMKMENVFPQNACDKSV